jgi:hypothetical protein
MISGFWANTNAVMAAQSVAAITMIAAKRNLPLVGK